jgi:hypothetical protein
MKKVVDAPAELVYSHRDPQTILSARHLWACTDYANPEVFGNRLIFREVKEEMEIE